MVTCQQLWENLSTETYLFLHNILDCVKHPETKAFICPQEC